MRQKGQVILLCESKFVRLVIGPHWKFAIALVVLQSIPSFVTLYLGLLHGGVGAFFVVATQLTAFCLLGLAILVDPGIVTDERVSTIEETNRKTCEVCLVRQRVGTVHCNYCDVCVKDYDHHCAWTSKCVGRGNVQIFYAWLLSSGFALTVGWFIAFDYLKSRPHM
eukprot:Trichotokara_eunicae@DN508_c0_g1_i2.p1